MFQRAMEWVIRHAPESDYYDECEVEEPTTTTTDGNGGNGGDSTSTTTKRTPSSAASVNSYWPSAFILAAMQVFTLGVYAQFKIAM